MSVVCICGVSDDEVLLAVLFIIMRFIMLCGCAIAIVRLWVWTVTFCIWTMDENVGPG